MSQFHYSEPLLKKFGYFDAKSVVTPYDPTNHLKKNRGDPTDQNRYAQIIESL